jgi:PEP-CTERM motif
LYDKARAVEPEKNMKKIVSLLPVICLAVASMSAKADSLQLVSNPSSTTIGPYTLTYTNSTSSTNLSLFCMNDQDEIFTGESWGVNVSNGISYEGDKKGTLGFEYEEEAFIYSLYNGKNATDIQDALWTVFDPKTDNTDKNSPAIVKEASNFALGLVGDSGSNAILSDATFYIYNGRGTDPFGDGTPQNFVGESTPPAATPEPSSLILFGSGLMGLAGMVRRKLARS